MKKLAAFIVILTTTLFAIVPSFGQDFLMSNEPVTTCSGTFYDNGGSSGNYSSSQFFTKTFTSTGNQRLQFTFQSFSTEACCDYLTIYDGNSTTGTFLGVYKGTNNPGIITSTGNSLTFVFGSDNSQTSSGFAATIACAGPVLTPYLMSNGTVNTCSGVFFDSGGQTGNYNNQENFTQTFCSGNGQKIQFSFVNTQFSLTTGDTLFAYDGNSVSSPLLAAFVGGSYAETLTSSGTCITFRFKSDFGPSVSQGWQAVISCTSTTPPANVFPMSYGIRGTCGGTFTDDGGLSGSYSNSQYKTQTFRSLNGERLRFTFQNFSTEACCDYMQIWDGPSDQATFLGDFRGGNSPGIITSTGNSLTFRFGSDAAQVSSGFAATIECLGPALTVYNMGSGTVNTCSGVFYDAGGSTGFYSDFENRTQTFCSDNGQKIQFTFTNSSFNLSTGDTLFAYDGSGTAGSLLGAYVAGSNVETLTSTGTCLTFRFKSDFGPSTGTGWQAMISCTTSASANIYPMSSGIRGVCNGTFTDDGGINGTYSSSQYRTQTFRSLNGERLRFTFQNFSTEACCDYLQIWDGPSDQAVYLGDFRGGNSPGVITSTGNSLTFRFGSDASQISSGFAASIECFDAVLPVYNMSSGTVNTCTGVFYDTGGQTGTYGNQENRTQTFCSGNGQKIQFTFTNSSFNLSTNDTLFAYDGSSVSSPMLGAFVTGSIVETLTSSGTCLTFRFKSDFGPSIGSGWQALISCTTSTPSPTNYVLSSGIRGVCSGTFTDDGGLTGTYNSSQSKTQTFRSLNNQRLRFTFQNFSTEACCDYLQVWDGPSTNSPFLGIFRGSTNPGVITSSGNSLTFQFGSDASQVSSGFLANIECFGTASTVYNMSSGTVNTCEGAFYDAGGSQGNYSTFENKTQTFCSNNGQHIQFNFNNKAFNVIDTLWVYDGNSANSNLVGIYVNGSYVEPLTSSGTCLTFRFKSGSNFSSGWASLISCVAEMPANQVYPMSSGLRAACSGIFTDDGGLTNNYSTSIARTQTFQSPTGERLRFVFQNFTTEANVDYLDIYDGPSVYYPRIARLTGTIAAGTTFTSTGNTLTFNSSSNSSTTYAGWAATIQCAGPALTTYNMSSGTVNTCSGVFYDSKGGGAAYSPNENRIQTFCSDNGQHIVFDFEQFELFDGDSLWVYDGSSAASPLVGLYVLSYLPEKISSTGTCLTFRFKSNGSAEYNGWKALISCDPNAAANLVYPMKSGIRATCFGIFSDDGGLSANYSNSQNRIQTFQSAAGQRIRFNFQQFALETNSDGLIIYDGPNTNSPYLGTFTGSQSPGIISSSGNSLTFNFYSNSSTTGNFAATIDCFDQALTAYNMSSGTTTTCSGMFYDNGGISSNYPLAENRTHTFCSGSTQKLQFTFNNLAFRMNGGDTLWAYDGNSINSTLLGYYISNSYVETITSTGTCITFRFKSDFSSTTVDQGWASQISCTSVTPPALVYPMSSGLRVACSGIFTDEGGLSANYFDYPSYRTQTFQSPTNSRLQFEFTQFQTNSNSDILYVYDGPNENYPLIGTYAVNNNPGIILSSGNSLTFSFYTNSSGNSAGWAANISCAGPALPIYIMSNNPVNACEGQWFDNGGLSNYPANTTVTQTFCSPTGQRMVFDFNFFGFYIAINDSLLVYDGNSVNSPLKAVITGGMPIEPIVSSGSCITFRFKSTVSSTQIGWSAKFSCSDNPAQPDVFPLSNGLRVACSGIFTDDGGLTKNYSDFVSKNLTFRSSTSGAKVQFSFSEFATQANSDVLYIYDGGSINSPLLGSYSGSNSPGIVTSTGSELTFRFISGSTGNAAGWKATLACVASVPLVGTLAFSPYCAGANLSIPFTSPNQTAGNVFTAQLSDASGQFSNPVNIGTFTGTTSGTIQATLPGSLTASGSYRIRIIGSLPATTGNPSSPFSIQTIPVQPSTISGSASVCAGAKTVSYSVSSIANANNYNWTVPNGASVVSGQGTNTVQIDWGISSGTVSVVASNSCGTGTARTLSVTVNSATAPTGFIVSNAVNSQVCEGGSVIFSASTTAGVNPSLQWLVNGTEFAGATGTQLVLSNLISNVAVALRVTPSTGCFNPSVLTTNTVNISVNPSQPVSVSISNSVGGAAICAGQSVTFNASAVNGGSAPTYSWRINGNPFSGNTGSTFTSTTLQNGDQVSLVLSSNASCPSPAQAASGSISMVVNPVLVPTVNISSHTGSNQTCAGNTLILTANTSNPGDSPNYQWFQNGNPLSGETNSTFITPSNLTGTNAFSVRLTSNAICANPTQVTSANFNVNVVSNLVPSVSATTNLGSEPVCVGTSITFTASPVNGGTSPTYQWRKNNTDIPGQTGSVFTSTTLANNDQITVRMTSNDPCASTPTATSQPVTVSIVSSLPTSVTATSSVSGNTICAGTSVTFTANPVNGGSNPSYQWSVNGVNQPGETESTFTTTNLSNNAQVRVRMTSSYSCATPAAVTSAPVTMTVSPSVTPTISVTSTQGNFACAGSSILLVASYTNGGFNPQFQWYFNGSPLTDSNNDSLLTPTGFAGTNNYTVEITSNASCVNPPTVLSSAWSVSVAANATPSVFVNSSVPGNTLCSGQSVTFTANPTNGGTTPLYQWRINGVNVAGQTSPTFTTSSLSNNDVVTVRLKTSITCASPDTSISNPQTMTITPNSPAAVTVTNNLASNTICNGQNVVFTANPVNGGTNPSYQWILNGADLPGQNNPTWSSFSLANGNQVSVRITSNSACANPNTATSIPQVMTVNPTVAPSVSLSSNPTGVSFCSGTSIQMTAIPENGGTAPVYEWKVNNNVIPGQTGSVFNFTLTAPSTVTATLISNAACANPVQATSGGQLFSVTPPQVVTAQADTAVCEATGAFQLNASPAGGTWSGTGVNSGGSFTPGATGTTKVYYSVPANGNLCAGRDSVLVTVKPRPVITFSNQGPFCQTAPAVQLTANPAGGTWTGTGVTATGLFTPATAGAGQTSVLYTATVNGCSSSKVLALQVNAPPTVDVGSNETVCFSTDAFQLNGLPAGGTWSGNGVDADGTFTPGFVTPGSTNNLTYSVTVNGCTASKIKQISVTDFGSPLNVGAGIDQTVCISDAAFVLQGVTGAGGSWTGTGVTPDGVFNPAVSGTGSFTLTYTVSFTQSPTCSGTDTKTVTVLAAPQAPAVQGDTVCRSGVATLVANGAAAFFNWYTTSTGGNPIVGQASPTYTTPVLNSSTTYYVSQKAGSCESPRTAVEAFVNQFNNAAFTNNTGLLTAEPANGQAFQWLLAGNPVTGATNGSFTPQVSGDYSVIIRLDGCADTSAQQFVLVTGINEPNARNTWTLHPNPVQNDLHIQAEGLAEIRVINMLGQCVKTKPSVEGPATTLWMGDLPAGVYLIELRGPNRLEMQMVVVRR